MRHDVSLALGKTGPNVDVMCTDKRFGGRFLTFAQVPCPPCMHAASPFCTLIPRCKASDALVRFNFGLTAILPYADCSVCNAMSLRNSNMRKIVCAFFWLVLFCFCTCCINGDTLGRTIMQPCSTYTLLLSQIGQGSYAAHVAHAYLPGPALQTMWQVKADDSGGRCHR